MSDIKVQVQLVTDAKELEKTCEPIIDIEEGLEISDRLLAYLRSYGYGIGLAANQVGENKQVCVISAPENEDDGSTFTIDYRFINPKVVELKNPSIVEGEGCLSFPETYVKTLRYLECKVVDALNPNGVVLTGLPAIAAQHEIDHLLGRTMFSRKLKNVQVNGKCPCGSDKKYKKCCMKQLALTQSIFLKEAR